MAQFVVSRESGVVLSRHRTLSGAMKSARAHCLQAGRLTIHEFPDKLQTGRVIARIAFDLETDWRGTPLDYWSDGAPII